MPKSKPPRVEIMKPNYLVIDTDDGQYLQSYRSIIAFQPLNGEKLKLDKNKWDYSATTGKHRNDFLGEKKAETEEKIKSGIYELIELN